DADMLAQAPEVTLPMRKRIARKHATLAHDDLFELLEIPLEASKKDVKRAYFRLSKEFHPDRYFGKQLGPFKSMLDAVFRALSQAADFLGDNARRSEYESMIRMQHEMRDLERSLARATAAALEEERRLAEASGAPPTAPVPTPAPRAAPAAPTGPAPARRLVR